MKDSFNDHKLSGNHPRNTFRSYPIISDQVTKEGLQVVWREFATTIKKGIPGHVVEFGCYAGTTSLFIRRLLNETKQYDRAFHVYDSFAGLPTKMAQDHNAAGIGFEAGKLYVSKADFVKVFQSAHLDLPVIHKGWFGELSESNVPNPIACAFLDGDFYRSIMDSLKHVWPKMSSGGVILVDDYKRETLPGVQHALRDFFQNKAVTITGEHNIAIIQVP
jgi:O-methyltransferase